MGFYRKKLTLTRYTCTTVVHLKFWQDFRWNRVPAVQVFPKEHRDGCHDLNDPGCSRKDEAHCILGISVETMLYAYEAWICR